MRRPFAIPLLSCLGIASCGGAEPTSDGRMQVARGGAPLFDAAATALYCADDTTLTVVGIGAAWTGAVAVRAPWPPAAGQSFPISWQRDSVGTSLLALRGIRDSVSAAFTADSGEVRLEAGPGLVLRFGARLIQLPQDTMRVTGEARGMVEVRCT